MSVRAIVIGMKTISATIIVDAPAGRVWELVAHQFDRIGEWATAIASSQSAPGPPIAAPGAPVAGRICRTGLSMVPEVTEQIVAYDETGRTLTYQAELIPGLLPVARNRWQVEAVGEGRARVTLHATVEARGVAGRLAYMILRFQIARTLPRFLSDLRHYVETGRPKPRRQRQLSRSRS